MSLAKKLPRIDTGPVQAHRLINTRYPSISLFDDVASANEFEALYTLQAMTNPRILTTVGDINLVSLDEIPFDIPGCSYAVAPFTHVNPSGSRFSGGDFGVLYLGESIDTALAEVKYHTNLYFSRVHGLKYERVVYQGLKCMFEVSGLADATRLDAGHPVLAPDSYSESQSLGSQLRGMKCPGITYPSVRREEGQCWGLFTPKPVSSIIQTKKYEMIWTGKEIGSVNGLVRSPFN